MAFSQIENQFYLDTFIATRKNIKSKMFGIFFGASETSHSEILKCVSFFSTGCIGDNSTLYRSKTDWIIEIYIYKNSKTDNIHNK